MEETEVVSIRIRKSLKREAKRLNINLKKALEDIIQEQAKVNKRKANNIAKKLRRSLNLSVNEWVNDVKETRLEE